MTSPTTTRAVLRRNICKLLGMPFFRYYNTYLTSDVATSTVAKLVDTDLTQPEHYWEGSWIFSPTTEEVRQIINFESANNMAIPDRDFTTSPSLGTEYEFHTGWNAYDIHLAIDRAIEEAFPHFFGVQTDEILIVQEDKLNYAITQGTNATNGGTGYFTYNPYKILKVWFEQPYRAQTGTATAGAVTTITAADDADLSDVATNPTNYYISIYDGTNRGEWRRIVSASNTTKVITISSGATNWTVAPDETSKYAIVDRVNEAYDWRQTFAVKFDRKEWPTEFYLPNRYQSVYGFRMKIEYVYKPPALTSDSDTTPVPPEFIHNKALSLLFMRRIQSNRFDRVRFSDLAEQHEAKARAYLNSNAWQVPQGTPWQEFNVENSGGYLPEPGDPMGWRQ